MGGDSDFKRSAKGMRLVGAKCTVCEEPLEHMLRGERFIQFVCQHVAHEECLYEYLKQVDSVNCPSCDMRLRIDPARGVTPVNIGESWKKSSSFGPTSSAD